MRKVLLILFLPLAVLMAAPYAPAQTEPAESGAALEGSFPEGVPAPAASISLPDPPPPLFNLEAEAGDSPQMLRAKAALRLFKAYNVTVALMTKCKVNHHEAGQILDAFKSRNGNTVGTIMATMRKLGGITPDMKKALDLRIAEEINTSAVDCRTLASEVQNGLRDIYKAEIYLKDYRLMRGRD